MGKSKTLASVWSGTDEPMERFVTLSRHDRDHWQHVLRRVTYDRDTKELLADEHVQGMSTVQLYRALDRPRRLRVEFHHNNKDTSGGVTSDAVHTMWEWCSGSSALTAEARKEQITHLPPVDYRYGWDIGRLRDQLLILRALLFIGVETLFSSPNCAPWGNHSRALRTDERETKRKAEDTSLTFLAVCCFLQTLMGRK